jgi:hypothetical protein
MAIYDTYKPFVVGNQFVPLVEASAIIDTGSEIGYRFIATEPSTSLVDGIEWVQVITNSPPPGVPNRSEIVCRLYTDDPVGTCTPIKQIMVPCTSGSGGAIGGGAATRQAAVANPSDPYYVRLTGASQTAKFWFGTDAAEVFDALDLWHVEIVDVSVIYAVSGPFATATTNTMSLGMERQAGPVKRYMDNLVTGPAASSSIIALKQSRFGELCPFWDVGTNPNTEPIRGPWVYRGHDDIGLYAMSTAGTDDVPVFLETGSGAAGDFDIHYVALRISYRDNYNIVGIGGMDLSGGIEIREGLYAYRCPVMPATIPWEYTGGGAITVLTMQQGRDYTLTVSRAYSGSISVSSPVPLPISLINTIDQNVPNLSGVRITKPTAEGALPAYTETTEFPPIVIFDIEPDAWATDMVPANVNPACHTYEQQVAQAAHDVGYFYSEQEIPDDTAGTFVWATFYARASSSVTSGLYVAQGDGTGAVIGPDGFISYADWLALPEIVDGWRKCTVRITPGAVLAGAGGVTYWQFWTPSDELKIWEVLGATANHTVIATGASSGAVGGYHGETAVANYTGTWNYPLDMTILLAQEMSPVTGLAASQLTQALVVVDEFCDLPVANIPDGIVYNHLAWDLVLTAMVSGWGYYEVQRRDTTMASGVWETIGKITNPYIGELDDYEARIGVQSSYRIRTVHTTGIEGPWSASVTSTIAAPGVTGTGCGVGLLVFTSNEDPLANLAYVHIHGGDDAETFDFVESGQGSLEPVFGRDYQIALRPVERGGVTFTRTVLVNKVGIPTGTLDRGFTSLRDLAWDAIPYVCVRDELANRWLSNITVPSGAIRRHDRRATHYQVSQIVITEVTGTPQAMDVATPYLGLTPSTNVSKYADLVDCAPLATVEDVEVRIKFIATGPRWVFYTSRLVGTPFSWWGCGMTWFDGGETFFQVLGGDGNFQEHVNTIVPIINQPIWIRWVYDHDNGAGKSTCTFYSSLDGVAWTSYGTITAGPAGLVPTALREFYIYGNGTTIIQEMIVIDSATATTIMSPDFAAQTATTTSFADAQSNTWEILDW